jgi:hypothetical protein
MRRPAFVVLSLLASVTLAQACSDSSGPGESDLTGDYPLFEVEFSQLPVLDKTTGFGTRLMITGGTLRVLSRDRVSFVTEVEYQNPLDSTDVSAISPETLTVAYTRTGDQLLVPFTNGPNGAYTDTIMVMNGFLRASRFRSHHEGAYQRRIYIYLTP